MNEENSDFFVELHDSSDLRKDLLLSSKQTIHTLKKYREFAELKIKKKQAVSQLSKTMIKIKELASSLQSSLPKSKVELTVSKKKIKEVPEHHTESVFLEKLNRIEERLKSLD
ncbi:hypothetical protein HY837_05810 [archaeon]|nr:hypothetical protein [archaeon]